MMNLNINKTYNNTNLNNNKMDIKRSAIYWVELPTIEGSSLQKGTRPCLILQNDKGNKYSSNVQICILTSQIRKSTLPTQVLIQTDNLNNLNKESVIQVESITNVPQSLIGTYIGRVSDEIMVKVDRAISIQLGLKEMVIQRPIIRLETIDMTIVDNKIFIIKKSKEMYDVCKHNDFLKMYELALEDLKNYTHKCGKSYSLYYNDNNDIMDKDTRIAQAV